MSHFFGPLTSAGTTSSAIVGVRAKAAYPVDFRKLGSGPDATGQSLEVSYTWSSSSGRLGDLDNVDIGEFVWYTTKGYRSGQKGNWIVFEYPKPPFDVSGKDGDRVLQSATDGPFMKDTHGGIELTARAQKTVGVDQYYWYTIKDAYHYWDQSTGKQVGDARDEQRIIYAAVWYRVKQTTTGWVLEIEKMSEVGHDGIQIPIPRFPWP